MREMIKMNWKTSAQWTFLYALMTLATLILSVFAVQGGYAMSEYFYNMDLSKGHFFGNFMDHLFEGIYQIAFWILLALEALTWLCGIYFINPDAPQEFRRWLHTVTATSEK